MFTHTRTRTHTHWLSSRVFDCGPGDRGSISGWVILKKWYLIPPCLTLSIIRFVSRVKWSNTGKGVASSSTPRCSSYWKGSFRLALDYGRKIHFYIYKPTKTADHSDIFSNNALKRSLEDSTQPNDIYVRSAFEWNVSF